MKMWYSTIVKTLIILILNFLPIIVWSDDAKFIIPSDKSELDSWFNATFGGALASDRAKLIKVRANGGGDFRSVSEAIKSIPSGNKRPVVVYIGPGTYREKITIPRDKPYITLHGDTKSMPVLVFNGTAAQYGTVDSATLTAEADHFNAVNLKVVNSAPRPDGKRDGAQAVAVRVGGDASAFYNCKFYGFQDTVFDYNGRHLFKDCYIEGTVDFIFGSGKSIYLNTELHVIPGDPVAFITAHARKSGSEQNGFVFVHCWTAGAGQIAFLGRAWFPYSRVVYAYTYLTDVVNPQGWSNNNDPKNDRTAFFGEFKNEGPGSKLDSRVTFTKKLKEDEANKFISFDFIGASSWLKPPLQLDLN